MVFERRSRLTATQQEQLIEYFVAGITARTASDLIGIQPNTAIRFFMRLRKLIVINLTDYLLDPALRIDSSQRLDKSRFPRKRKHMDEVTVFGLFERNGKVHVARPQGSNTEVQNSAFAERIIPASIVHARIGDRMRAIDASARSYQQIGVLESSHGNMMASTAKFWWRSRSHMRQFHGIKPTHFYWFLKECEWRFSGDSPRQRLKQLTSWYGESRH